MRMVSDFDLIPLKLLERKVNISMFLGQQQLIKIMRNPNGQPLTQEGVKAIVKEVTGQDASKMLGKVFQIGFLNFVFLLQM